MSDIQIYVACLASYNAGQLHGVWIDARQNSDAINAEIFQMLANSPVHDAEEWAIHDNSGFCGVEISEYAGLDYIIELAEFIEEYQELGAELINYFDSLEYVKTALSDYYNGEWDSEKDFSENLFNEINLDSIPENLKFYIDYEKFNRDIFICDYVSIPVRGKVHVFQQF